MVTMGNQQEKHGILPILLEQAILRCENEKLKRKYKYLIQLREKQILYNRMLRDYSPDDIIILDDSLKVLFCTATVNRCFGCDMVGKQLIPSVAQVFGEEFAGLMEETLRNVLQTGEGATFYERIYNQAAAGEEEREFILSMKFSPANDNDGNFVGIVVLVHDNSEMHGANIIAETAAQAG